MCKEVSQSKLETFPPCLCQCAGQCCYYFITVLSFSLNISSALSTPTPPQSYNMEDPTWFWGGVEPWKPPQRHISNKRHSPLGGIFVKPTWETTYRKHYRTHEQKQRSFVPREKLRLCEEQRLKPPAARPKLYYKQYEKKYWN